MDPVTIAAVLAPLFAPFLRRAGAEVRDGLAAHVGRDAATVLGGLWDRMRGHLPEDQSAETTPPSEATLEEQIARMLAEHPDLLRSAESVVLTIQGSNNVVQQGGQNINISGGSDIQI